VALCWFVVYSSVWADRAPKSLRRRSTVGEIGVGRPPRRTSSSRRCGSSHREPGIGRWLSTSPQRPVAKRRCLGPRARWARDRARARVTWSWV